jgi:hypothetical protein
MVCVPDGEALYDALQPEGPQQPKGPQQPTETRERKRCSCQADCNSCLPKPPTAPADPPASEKCKRVYTCWRDRKDPLNLNRTRCRDCEAFAQRQRRVDVKQRAAQGAAIAALQHRAAIAALQHATRQLAAIGRDGAGGAALVNPVEVVPSVSATDQPTAALSTKTAISTGGSPAAAPQPVLAQPAAQPVAAKPAALTTAAPAETAIGTGGSPSGSPGGSPDAARQSTELAQPVDAAKSPRPKRPPERLMHEHDGPQQKKAAIVPKVVHAASKPASDFVSSLEGRLLLLYNIVVYSSICNQQQWLESRRGVSEKAVSSTYISFNAPELMPDNKFYASKCLWYCSDSTWKRSYQYTACKAIADLVANTLGMKVVGSGALVFDLKGVKPDWRVGKRQGCHYDWNRSKLDKENAAAATLLFNLDEQPAYLWVALPVEAPVWCLDKSGNWEQRAGFVASKDVVKITVPSMGAVVFDHTVWHGGHVYTTMHMRAHFYMAQKDAAAKGLDFRNYSKGEVSLFDGEGYPLANNSDQKQMEWATAKQLEEDAAVPTVSNPLFAVAELQRMRVAPRSVA